MYRIGKTIAALALVLSAFAWSGGAPVHAASTPGAVYAMSNEATGNRILVFNRAADGTLTPGGSFATGGLGSGTFENSSDSLILTGQSPDNLGRGNQYLFAANAGSNDISVFEVRPDGLVLVDKAPSGGDHPISVTYRKKLLYVLNGGKTNCTGGTPSITGFTVGEHGTLTPIPGSTRLLPGGPNSGCAEVSFNPQADVLVVTEVNASIIDTFIVGNDGVAMGPIINQPNGQGPFGFTFTQRGQLLTTEHFFGAMGAGTASSYQVPDDGVLIPISGPVANTRSDSCWIVVTDNDKYAYVANFQSGDISSYTVAPDGTLALLQPIAAPGVTEGGASDQAMSLNSHYLYLKYNGGMSGQMTAYKVESNGTLTFIQGLTGLPLGAIGLAAK